MTKTELKEKAIKEIINCLYNLDSEIFPNFGLCSCELMYGIQQTDDGDILLETNYKDKNDKIILRLKVDFLNTEEIENEIIFNSK